ncbi:MAG: tetratricopeptide repeat protein [Anaerolineales bacterium]|nr:tetratricopeptide repeat protein [Anaerolineales bacterium]
MQENINLVRILPPQKRKDILRRGRLVDQLHLNTSRKLNFISASAGFGKTSLMLDFAHELDAAVCWYQVARGDEDLVQFIRYLILAFRQKFKRFGRSLENNLNTPGGLLNPESLATALVNEVVAQVDDFCVLFVDDFHLVGEAHAISEFLEVFLDYLPEQLRIVIASRSVYGIPTAKLYIRDQIATLGVEDLRFRADEIAELVRQNFKTTLPGQALEALAKRSDGWIVAILLSMQSLLNGRPYAMEGFTAEQVYTFLAQEVIERESDTLQAFMLATSIQDEFNEAWVNEALAIEPQKAQHLIQELERRNLFVTRIETAEGVSFRYHQLFLDFLRDRLQKTDPAQKQHLHRRTAAWYQARAGWEMAITHQLAAGNRAEAAAWMDAEARNFYVTGRGQVLAKWVAVLATPPDMRLMAPRLLLNWAKVLSGRGEYGESERLLALAEPELIRQGDQDQILNLKIQRGHNYYAESRFEEASSLASELQRAFSEEVQHTVSHQLRSAQTYLLQGNCFSAKGDFVRAIENLEKAVNGFQALYTTLEQDSLQIHVIHDWGTALNDLGAAYYGSSNILAAQAYFQEALKVRKMNQSNHLMLAESLNNLGYLHFQAGAYREAWGAYQEAIEILKPIFPGRVHIHVYNSLGDLLCALEEWKGAEETYRQAIDFAQGASGERALFATYCGLAQIEAKQLRYHAAFQWLRDAAQVRKMSEDAPLYQEKLGEIYMAMGQMRLAKQAFEQALYHWGSIERPRLEQVLALFFLGKILFLHTEVEQALAHLQTSMEWTARMGIDEFLVLAGRQASAFLEFAAHRWPTNNQLQSLCARVQAFQPGLAQISSPAPIENLSKIHLEISALGAGTVRRDGKSIAKTAWQSSKPRALFFYLVEHRQARASDIKLDFWPEFNTSRATTNLQATLWRARNALASKEIILNQEEEYSLPDEIDLWYDVDEFRNYLSRATDPLITPFDRAECWRRAVELYQGDYLADILMEWVEPIRRDLLEKYLDALLNLAKWEMTQHHYPQAIRYYGKAIEKEPFEDEFHQAIMECWVKAGSLASAKAHFVQYQKKLDKEGLTPSKPLIDYYTTLFRSPRGGSTPRKK